MDYDPDYQDLLKPLVLPEHKLIAACILEAARNASKGDDQDLQWFLFPGPTDQPFSLAWCCHMTGNIMAEVRALCLKIIQHRRMDNTKTPSRLMRELEF